ncbi:biotin carboxylase N-terminal domain-containing protein [Kribbella sp. VKM Ac-2566]|uniref:acetyl/propionyl/methylcrotonyl-CoA carboxylase subunit alpha n=1 Tax=Kribbella sp. VKM Ac-2566 TaxID=2512218 RepID=UPI001062B9C0|nr:biotin carboxylase N-terminal domain-containing protein [Kribbella sp. VKM Ac-2566]TDX08856.1 propionyl-CoA carboxylase alpha chain [Kribbella sp. VKM Ac-2566]
MITSVLVANRGEIARRIFRTGRSLGLSTVAVYSSADARMPFVDEADTAVHLPGNTPGETYLRSDLIIDAARRAGADAVHPGYGFLSENAAFAQAVIDAGLTWIGPPVDAISSMGSKIEAKKLMAAAGVPVLAELTPAEVSTDDLPVLVKASAGGGGRGMRVVSRLEDLAAEIDAASAEALSAFGDGTVFCERYLATGRHIEVQVMADRHGTIWAVGERECSIQRRHQKVVEEAPSPLVERIPSMRADLFDAARKAAAAINYVGAGTVEFLADEDGNFYFLEMNTRLQVEHPVTEETTGLDLVALQFAVAAGDRLTPEPHPTVGHAIEVRLYAEDPLNDWRPQTGHLHRFAIGDDPQRGNKVAPGGEKFPLKVRVDSGVEDGSEVSPYYDPMLAKVIAYGSDRAAVARRLAGVLERATIHGVGTNRDLLAWILRHPAFLAGDTDTAFFDKHGVGAGPDDAVVRVSALAAALADAAGRAAPVRVPSGWRNLASQPQRKSYRVGDVVHEVAYRHSRDGLIADGNITLLDSSPERVVLEVDGVRRSFAVAAYDGITCVDSSLGSVALHPVERFVDPADQVAAGSLVAPMPGTVIRVGVAVGDVVKQGQPLLWLEAMKMEHTIAAPADGVVGELKVEAGQQVEVGAVLAVVGEDA